MQVSIVDKMIVKGQTVFAKRYHRVKKSISYAVKLNTGVRRDVRFGLVEAFILYENVAIALLKELLLSSTQINDYCDIDILDQYVVSNLLSHIYKVEVSRSVVAIDSVEIVEKVVFMRIPSQTGYNCYVSCLPNCIECD